MLNYILFFAAAILRGNYYNEVKNIPNTTTEFAELGPVIKHFDTVTAFECFVLVFFLCTVLLYFSMWSIKFKIIAMSIVDVYD